ncbi:MAG: helix-turn-helix domain-containing protein [Planctomycetota bacterium]
MTSQRAPRGWKERVKWLVLNVISLGRVCTSVLEAEDVESTDPQVRGSAEVEALHREIRLLNEELSLKDARLSRVSPRKRQHYSPTERMRILELKAARGWSTAQTAEAFLVTPATVASWQRTSNIDDGQTPNEIHEAQPKEAEPNGGNLLCISFYKGKRHLPVVTTRSAAA